MPRARGTGLLSIDSSEQFLHSARRRRAELLVESNRLRELLSDELVALHQFAIRCKRPLDALGVATTQLVVLLAWQRGPRFRRVLLTLVEDLFDVVGWPYDGVDHVVLDDVHETMLDPAKSDHPLVAVGAVAQTPCDVAANLNLHSRLAEINIAAVAQFKAHHVLQQSTNGSSAIEQGDDRRRQAEFSAGQNRDLELSPSDALTKRSRRLSACQTILDAIGNLLADSRQVEEFLFAEDICGFFGNLPIHRRLVPKIIIPIHAWHCVQDLFPMTQGDRNTVRHGPPTAQGPYLVTTC